MVTCDRCGKPLPAGSSKYLIIIQATADFDGFLRIEDDKYSSDAQLERLIQSLKEEPEGQAMKDVFEKKALILCPACKKAFMENPLQLVDQKEMPVNGHFIQ